jgi:hypothetical protein
MEVFMLYKRNENMGAPLESRRAVVLEKIQKIKNEVLTEWTANYGGLTWAGSDAMSDLVWLEKRVRGVKTLRRLEKLVLRSVAEYGIYDEVQRAFLETMPR